MKKNKNDIIQDWLGKHGIKKIEELVKKEIEHGLKSPIVDIKT